MLIRLSDLRNLIREEVFRNYMWSAGIAPGGIGRTGVTTKPSDPLPGLGPEVEDEDEQEEEPRR